MSFLYILFIILFGVSCFVCEKRYTRFPCITKTDEQLYKSKIICKLENRRITSRTKEKQNAHRETGKRI